MYNTRERSELLDSLDYLIPPVKKFPRAVYNDFLYNDVKLTNPDRLVRDCHRTVFVNTFGSKTSDSDVQTCSSLILKKTTKQLIHEQYSILNLSTCNRCPVLYIQNKTEQRKEEKPLIKVTVIPKAKETQTSTLFKKPCRYPKIIQSTASNEENFIKNQNVYLFTNCNKREEIHELKTSESAKLSNRNICHKYGDISFKHITESRQIINSLNMDKRKRKENKNKKVARTHISDVREAPPKERYSDKFSSPNDRKSRVTVVGQIGINQDDRYVLKCAAAVNGKPIETNCIDDGENPISLNKNYNFHRNSSQYRPPACNVNNCETFRQFRQQNSDVQTDIANPYYLPATTHNNSYRGASQSTQVNFNFSNSQSIKKFRNQTAQCDCNRATTENPLDSDTEGKLLKKCKSPLVIISVYPRQAKGTNENDAVKIIQRQTSPERNEVTNTIRNNVTQENVKQFTPGKLYTSNKIEAKLPRSRSPSPKTKFISKKNNENKTDSRGRNNNNSVKKCGLNQTASHKYYIINSLEDNTSCHCHDSRFLQTEDIKRQENKIKTNKSKDTAAVKKALVNSFIRNVNAMDKNNRKAKLFQPKDDASRVTINIDGENDRYDVLLEQSHYDTDVSIKKTTKPRPSQVFSSEEEINTKSLENFLLVSNERRKNEYKQEREQTQPPDVLKIKPTGSRLNIKDSIEIFRRQGEHANYLLKPHLKNDNNDFVDTDSYAPVKHYRGDNCSLSDPNERDREIRQLLGIKRNNRQQKIDNTDFQPTTKVSCCCRKKWPTDNSCSKCFTSKYLKPKSTDTKHVTGQLGPSEPQEKIPEISEPNQEHEQKLKISKKTTVTQKTEYERMVEHPDLKASEEETSQSNDEPTTEDSCKQPKHIKNKNATDGKTISKKEKNYSKTVPKKEQSAKEKHDSMVHMENNTMPSNLILNRNVQIFLQVEKFNKERPIVLTRTQYDKVKRIIDSTISKKLSREKRKRCSLKNCDVVSIGEIKVKPKFQLPLCSHREMQTERSTLKKIADYITDRHKVNNTKADDTKHIINKKVDKKIATDVVTERLNIEQVHPREAVSSMEIRYTSVEYKKRLIISSSSTHFKNDIHTLQTSNDERNSNSIHTLFKGHKKSATPNLGTSACSVYSNVTDFSTKFYKPPQCAGDYKPKKPFLQRLISCLVMRSTQTSNIKDAAQKRQVPSVRSSLDSYHISTSLGALEMSSSLYDTSASFYSNHTTMPVNKIKRGFFSSVRGFLTSRRS